MRLGYLLPRLIIVGCVWAFFAFAFDPLLRYSVIAAGQSVTGAKVDVDGLDTTFFPPTFAMRDVAVANPSAPMQNIVEFENLRFSMWGRPLLKRKIVVEEASLDGIEFGTERATSGELPKADPNAEPAIDLGLGEYFDTLEAQAVGLGDAWLNDLVARIEMELDPNQLASVKMVQALEKDWKQRLGGLEQRVADIETRIKALKQGVDDVGRDPIDRIRAYQQAATEARTLLDEAKSIRTELSQLGGKARGDFAQIDVVRKQDMETIRSKADLLKMDGREITESLLGPTVSGRLAEAGEWLAFVQRYAAAFSTPQPTRLRGTDFTFPRPEDDLPNFLVERIRLGGRLAFDGKPVPFEGIVTDVTTEPRRLDRPMLVKIVSEGDASVRIDAVIDQRPEVPVQDVTIAFALPRPTEMRLGDEGDELQLGVTAARTDCKARFRIAGRQVDGRIAFEQTPVTIVSQAGDGVQREVARVLAGSLGDVRSLRADVAIGGTFDNPTWQIESNLGPQLASGLDTFLASELEARKAELVAKANALVDERVSELQGQLDGRFREIVAQLDLDEVNARSLIQQLAGGRLNGIDDRLNGIVPGGILRTGGGPNGNLPPSPTDEAQRRFEEQERKLKEKLERELKEKLERELEEKLKDKNPFDLLRRR